MAEVFDRPWIEKYRPEFLHDVVGTINFFVIFT